MEESRAQEMMLLQSQASYDSRQFLRNMVGLEQILEGRSIAARNIMICDRETDTYKLLVDQLDYYNDQLRKSLAIPKVNPNT